MPNSSYYLMLNFRFGRQIQLICNIAYVTRIED